MLTHSCQHSMATAAVQNIWQELENTTMVDIGATIDRDKLYRKIGLRILPLLVLCYTFAYLDRVNIGYAKLQMTEDVGISESAYGLAAGIFFLAYALFEVPSNLLLEKIGTRKTLFRIMVLWGITSATMMFVTNAMTFYVLRFLLGVFEAGFAPGIIFYLTLWFPRARMAGAMALLMIPGPLGSMIGGPISSWTITRFNGTLGLAGWQWMFLAEGLPCVLLGFVVWKTLVDRPNLASWLTDAEKAVIQQEVSDTEDAASTHNFRQVLRDPRIYALAIGYFCLIGGLYTVAFWLPTILKENGVASTTQIGHLSAAPYLVALLVMFPLARHSDKRGERRLHSSVPALAAAAALLISALTANNFLVSFVAIIVATACLQGAYIVFWAIPAGYLSGTAAAGGIAFINSIGLLGGFFSPTLIGYIKDSTGSASPGLVVMAGVVLVGGLLIFANRLPRKSPFAVDDPSPRPLARDSAPLANRNP